MIHRERQNPKMRGKISGESLRGDRLVVNGW